MTPRQQAYRELLERGLLMLRNSAFGRAIELCEIEADHLHNIPSLLDEANEARHRYYIESERALYLARLRQLDAASYRESSQRWYAEPWNVLADMAGVELTDPAVSGSLEPGRVS